MFLLYLLSTCEYVYHDVTVGCEEHPRLYRFYFSYQCAPQLIEKGLEPQQLTQKVSYPQRLFLICVEAK